MTPLQVAKAALEDIRRHVELSAGSVFAYSATYIMAGNALARIAELEAQAAHPNKCNATWKHYTCSFAYAHQGRHEYWDGDPDDIVNRKAFWFDEFNNTKPHHPIAQPPAAEPATCRRCAGLACPDLSCTECEGTGEPAMCKGCDGRGEVGGFEGGDLRTCQHNLSVNFDWHAADAYRKGYEAAREMAAKVADACNITSAVTGSARDADRWFADGFNTGAADASTHIAEDIRSLRPEAESKEPVRFRQAESKEPGNG